MKRAAHLAVVLMFTAASAAAGGKVRSGGDLIEACPSGDLALARACDEAILSVVLQMVTKDRHDNPFSQCPIDINDPDAFQGRLDSLRALVTGWAQEHPETKAAQASAVIRRALMEGDACGG